MLQGRALYPGEDQWAAVLDATTGRDWVQVGDSCHPPGKSHNVDCGHYPPWGDDAGNQTYGNPTWNYVVLWQGPTAILTVHAEQLNNGVRLSFTNIGGTLVGCLAIDAAASCREVLDMLAAQPWAPQAYRVVLPSGVEITKDSDVVVSSLLQD